MDLIPAYMKRLDAQGREKLTKSFYNRLLSQAEDFLKEKYGTALTAENAPQIKGYMLDDLYQTKYMALSPSTRNTYVTILQGFFKYLNSAGFTDTDPSRVLIKIKEKKSDDADPESVSKKLIPSGKIEEMIEDTSGVNYLRNRAIIETLAGTGLRCEEVVNLNVGTIRNRSQNDLIYVLRKGGRWKWVPISSAALSAIKDYLNTRSKSTLTDDSPLFLSTQKNRINKRSLYRMIAERQKRAGLPTGVHNFRYTVLNRVERNADPVVAMRIAGHASLSTTRNYMVATPEELSQAINAKKV